MLHASMRGKATAERLPASKGTERSEEHTSELQSRLHLVCRLLLEKKNANQNYLFTYTVQIISTHGHLLEARGGIDDRNTHSDNMVVLHDPGGMFYMTRCELSIMGI